MAGVNSIGLAFFSLRNAWSTHERDLGTRAGFELAAKLEPGDARNWFSLGRYLQYNIVDQDLDGAIEACQKALALEPFPGPGGKWQVSTEGGCQVRWRRDGRELYFMDNDKQLIAVDVKSNGPLFELGVPHVLFQSHIEDPSSYNYDVTSDGQRFLCNDAPEKSTTDITLVVNWDAELKKK